MPQGDRPCSFPLFLLGAFCFGGLKSSLVPAPPTILCVCVCVCAYLLPQMPPLLCPDIVAAVLCGYRSAGESCRIQAGATYVDVAEINFAMTLFRCEITLKPVASIVSNQLRVSTKEATASNSNAVGLCL